MAIIGSAYVEIRALDSKLQRDIDNAVSKIKDVNLTLQANVNLKPVRDKISLLRAELKRNPLKFDAEVDLLRVHEELDSAYELYNNNPLQVKANVNASNVETTLERIKNNYGDITSTVQANADTARAEAQIATAARHRRSTIHVGARIDPAYQKALKGLAYTMAGAIPGEKVKAAILGTAGNFETLAVAGAKLATVMGSIGAAGLTLGSNVLALASDLSKMIGIAALAPAVFAGMGAGIAATVLGWKGFSKAMTDEKELAKLPAEAQAAVLSLKGLGGEIRKTTQASYWKEMGTSIQRLHEKFFPALQKGLEGTGRSMGKWGKGFADALHEAGANGNLEKMFTHINKGLENASKGVKPFTDALFKLGVQGSRYLDHMGTQLAGLGTKFDAWVTKSIKSGDFDRWVMTASANFEDLGRAMGGVYETFAGLTRAARASGGKGLDEFANGLEKIADTVNSEPFQSNLVTILKGARRGAEALGDGFAKISKVVGDSSTAIGGFLTLAGQVGGSILSGLSKVFDGTGVGNGLIIALDGAKKAIDSMDPTFRGLGQILGDLGEIAGTLFVNMAPGLNNLMDTMSKVIAEVKDGLMRVIPVFNTFIQAILQVAAPIAIAVADALGNIFNWFADLPGVIQTAILSFGLFLLLKKKFFDFFAPAERGASRFRDTLRNTAADAQTRMSALAKPVNDAFATTGVAAGYARQAVAKNFSTMADNAKISGMYIADGFKKSFAQIGEHYKSNVAEPMSRFKAGFKSAFVMPHEVHDGFKRVGATVENTFRDAKDKVRNSITDMGTAVKNEVPHMKGALKEFPREVKGIFDDAKISAANAVDAMGEKVRDRSIYASKHLEDAGKGIKTAASDVKAGAVAIGNDLRAMASPAEAAVKRSVASMAVAGSVAATVLKNNVVAATEPMRSQISSAVSGAKSQFTSMANHVKSTYSGMTAAVAKSFAPIGVASVIAAGVAKDKLSNAASSTSTAFARSFGSVKDTASDMAGHVRAATVNVRGAVSEGGSDIRRSMQGVGTAFTNLGTMAGTASGAIKSQFATAAASLKTNFGPAAAAIKQSFSGISGTLNTTRTAMQELGKSAGATVGAVGKSAGKGLASAAGGLMGALGGPWGLAIGAATTAITLFAQAEAESKARTDALSQSLDQQTGAFTGQTKKLLATNALDGVTNGWDDFVRGVFQNSRSIEELLGNMGMSTQDYTDKLADPKGRDAFVKGFQDISDALLDGRPITDEMAKAIGRTKEELKGMSSDEFDYLADKAGGAAKELSNAEKQVKDLAAATGTSTVKAAIMAKNFDILKNSTSSAADKFAALKQNIELLNKSPLKVDTGQKGYQQTLRDTADAIKAVKEANNGIVKNLFDVKKGFDFTKQAGSDLHTALEGQSDGILKLGTAAMEKVLKNGGELKDANTAAMAAMKPAIDSFKGSLKEMGFGKEQIDGIISSLGLVPDKITTALNVEGAEKARIEIFNTAVAADAFKNGNYTAVLAALPDAAKREIEEVTGMGGAFAKGDYEGILTALDNTEGGRTSALLKMVGVTDGKYEALLTAKDGTPLGVKLADGTIRTLKGKEVILSAKDAASYVVYDIKRAIDSLKDKSVTLTSTYMAIYKQQGAPAANQYLDDSGMGSLKKANGGIINSRGLETFANGGFSGFNVNSFARGSEKHVAQIARGKWPVRIWAEPETGGEAYLPLSKGKRKRSTEILEQVAKMFGMGVFKYANGGTSGGSSSSSSGSSSIPSSSNVAPALMAAILRELKKGANLSDAGEFIVDGLIEGVNNKSGKASQAMTAVAGSLDEAVRTRLEIHSPSKTFLGLGKHIVDGLTLGIKTNAGQVHKQISTLANRIYVAASDVQKATGRSVGSSLALLNRHKTLNVAWKKMASWKYTDQIVDYYQKTGKTGNRTLADIARAREDVNSRLATTQTKLKNLQTARADVFKDVSNNMRNEFKLGTSIIGDTNPYIPKMKFSDVKNYTTGLASRLKTFNSKIQALRKKGVSAGLIQEVASLGSVEGISVADAILQGSTSDIKGLNNDFASIGTISNQVGNTTADAMYKVGIDAQAGLVRGLQKDSASLTSAANKLTGQLIAQVKKNLGIRSPSRVFAEIGVFTGQGLIQGMDSVQGEVDKRVNTMINLDPRQVDVNGSRVTTTTTNSGPQQVVNLTVNPSTGMDEQAVGRAAVKELNWKLLSR